MGCKFLPWPLSSLHNTTKKHHLEHSTTEDDQYSSSQMTNHCINSSSDSSTNSSFSSQRSLPSVPSLAPSSNSQNTLQYQSVATLKGHASQVFSLALAGKKLFSGESNGEIRVWDQSILFDGTDHRVISSSTVVEGCSAVKSMVVLGDDKLITSHQDHKIRVWNIDATEKAHTHNNSSLPPNQRLHPHHHYKLVTTLPTLNDRCMSLLSGKNYVRVRRHKTSTWVHHVDAVSSLTLSPDGTLLYSVSWDRTLKIWRASDFKCMESIQNAHDDAINSVALSKMGIVFTGSADKTIKAWRRKNAVITGNKSTEHALICTLKKHKSAVNALALSSDESLLYSGACDRSIVVWRRFGGDGEGDEYGVIGALRGHKKAILCLAVVDGLLLSGSSDRTVRVWRRDGDNRASHCCLAVFEGHNGPIKCLSAASLSRDDEEEDDDDRGKSCYVVYSGSLDFDVKVWQFWVQS